jgi:phenylalanyl-tRNA synthetase beta chain
VLTYSFIHGDVLTKSGQSPDDSYKLTNSLSPDLQYYRQSITPSLLGLVHGNLRQGFSEFAIYELNKVHPKQAGLDAEKVPAEVDSVAFVLASKLDKKGVAYYTAKATLDYVAKSLGLRLQYKEMKGTKTSYEPFEPKRSATVCDDKGNEIGVIGEYKTSVSRAFKLPALAAGFELNARALFEGTEQVKPSYQPVGKYPGTTRDVCFQVDQAVAYGQISDIIEIELSKAKLETTLEPVDIYQPKDKLSKNITFRIGLASRDHTLTSDDANKVVDKISDAVVKATDAKVI